VRLGSRDLFAFGGPSRLAYRGVPKTMPGTGRPEIGLAGARLNVTLREPGRTRTLRQPRARRRRGGRRPGVQADRVAAARVDQVMGFPAAAYPEPAG
jgi:hypothetical protein